MFGVWAPGEDVAKLTYYGLYALQHRGQEAAGIAVSDGSALVVYKDLGLVAQVFDEPTLDSLRGHIAVGHTRYSTTGSSTWENAQPTFRTTRTGTGLALGHNGNLVNTAELAERGGRAGVGADASATTDSDLITALLAARPGPVGGGGRAGPCCRPCAARSRWCSWTSTRSTRPATRRACARSCWAGSTAAGWWPARPPRWTSSAPRFVREVEPGELIAIDDDGLRSEHFAAADAEGLRVRVRLPGPAGHHDLRPQRARRPGRDRPPAGPRAPGRGRPGHPGAGVRHPGRDRLRRGVRHPVRPRPGEELLRRPHVHPAVPDHPAARHPAQAQPAARRHPRQAARRRRRLDRARQHPAGAGPDAARGRRARGARAHLLAAGEVAVLLRHRLRHRAELVANGLDIDGVRASIGADSLGYVSLDGLVAATEQPATRLCTACFDGEYPIPLPARGASASTCSRASSSRSPPASPGAVRRTPSRSAGSSIRPPGDRPGDHLRPGRRRHRRPASARSS